MCFDVPYPPDYGGVIDLYFKIKALHQIGISIHLHCFEYGRGNQPNLEKYCTAVIYYSRSIGVKGLSFNLPYIVRSRANEELLNNLLLDNHPILLEGIHCCYFLYTGQLANRKVFIRLHNVEYLYYRNLAKASLSFKKLFFLRESFLLKKFERYIASKAPIIAVTPKDAAYYKNIFAARDVRYIPIFIPWTTVRGVTGSGSYCLYHGNLSVPENDKAAKWIIENLATSSSMPFIIAGNKPSAELQKIALSKNIQLEIDPTARKMEELIRDAHIHILPSFNETGMKVKLLNALFNGRHCVVNNSADQESQLETLSHHGNNVQELIELIESLAVRPFSEEEKLERTTILMDKYDNTRNAENLIASIW